MTAPAVAPHVVVPPTRMSLPAYVLLAWLVSLAGSLLLAALASGVAHTLGLDAAAIEPPAPAIGWIDFFGIVVFAPVVETALLAGLLAVLGRVMRSPAAIATVSALLWGGMHGLIAPLWFFGTVWAFFVFSYGYLAWRPRSRRHAFAAAAIPHALQNLAAFGLFALASRG